MYRRLDAASHLLILCSDGLTDLCHGQSPQEMARDWAHALDAGAPRVAKAAATPDSVDNLAVKLLRHVLGGEDTKKVSQALMLDSDVPWLDDTTCIVQTL